MFRALIVLALALLPVAAHAQAEQQALVDRATLTLQDMLAPANMNDPVALLRRARAVMVCPRIFRAGFILGGSGGACVLVARDGGGGWSAPAFYTIGTGSIGLQAGIQDNQVIMMIMSQRALNAIMDSSFKIGGNASITFATIGAGIEGGTTASLTADIVAYSKSRGLFVGVALDGSLLGSDTSANRAYYGQDLAARQIVMQMQANNPGASPLRAALTRFGSAAGMQTAAAPAPMERGPAPSGDGYQGWTPAPTGAEPGNQSYGAPQPLAPIRQESLPPPRR